MLAANVCTAEFLARAQASGALPRARRAAARKARGAARLPRELARCTLAGGDEPTAADYAKLLLQIQRPPRLRAAADGAAALAVAGAVPAGQRRPFRPRLRGLRAFHVADPPLSRPARPPRDQGGARRQATTSPAGTSWERARRALLDDRAPRRRRDARRRATGSSATTCRTRSARSSTARSAASRASASSSRSTASTSTASCTSPSSARDYFHFDAGAARADRRAQRPRVPARRPCARQASRASTSSREDRFHAGRGRRRRRLPATPRIRRCRAAHRHRARGAAAAPTLARRGREQIRRGTLDPRKKRAAVERGTLQMECRAAALAIGLRRHAQVRPQRLVALRELLLEHLGILQRRHDDDVVAVLPVAPASPRCGCR